MKRSMKCLVTGFVLLFSMTMLFGCGNGGQDKPEGGKTAEDVVVKIGLLSIDDSFPFYVAEQEGLFEAQGVKVELVPFSSARDKDTALEAGEIDGDMTDFIVTALMKKGGTEVRAVTTALGAEPSEGRFVLLAAPNSGIKTIADLKGQPIGIGNNTIIQFVADEILLQNGFTQEEINTQNIPDLKLRLDTLLAGNSIQAAILPDPLASLGILEGAVELVDDTKLTDENGQPLNLSQSVVIFRTDSLGKKEEAIAKVIAAYDQAKEMINQDGEKYRPALIEFSKVPAALADTYAMPHYTTNTVPTEEEVARVMDWMADKGLLDQAFAYDEIIDTHFIQ